ncbi:grl-28 [Pristionchus pacificus]|uniref:Grl-28 n=1 Tax=Pristionchus pacificus TaxID=54126 RepID=A0A2A6C2G5_PRIPA|nr:grl-28 [Pristionchus pacificus]|eukprot:PDM72299.1 grl-28 [Pristionchus pacificus]
MRLVTIAFILLICSTFVSSLFFGGGGCGCGCGGGCGGGCGRKKREAGFGEENHEEEEPFGKLSANGTDLLCNSLELKTTIQESMRSTLTDSKRALSSILESFGDRFVVVCSRFPFEYAVRHDTAYCAVTKGDHTCKAFSL